MSSITSYKTTAFKESQKFLVIDPSTQSPSLVLGSDMVSYITPMLNYVRADSTRLSAENTDYDVGTLVQTSGATSPGDNFAATYLVVEGGSGDFPMLNGNDLLVIKGDEFLREQLAQNTVGDGSDLVAHTGTSDTVTEALDKRTIFVGSVADLLSQLDPEDGQEYGVTGFRSGTSIGGGRFFWNATKAKSEHNGVTVFDPTKTLPSDFKNVTQVTSWLTPNVSGSGCYVRILDRDYVLSDETGCIKDGDTSNLATTLLIQSALDSISSVCLTDGDYTINASSVGSGLTLNSDQSLWFTPNAKIIASQSNSASYRLLLLTGGANNIVLWEPKVVGDRSYTTETVGEQGMGLWAVDAHNVSIKGGYFKDCFGDGILVGGAAGQECSDWTVDNVICQNNRRQGLSVVGGIDLTFNDCRFLDTNGTAPEYGVDIEPNTTDTNLKNINFNNCYAKGNNSGVGFGVFGLAQTSEVNINFTNCVSETDRFIVKNCSGNGLVTYKNCKSINANIDGMNFVNTTLMCQGDVTIINPNQSGSTTEFSGTGLRIEQIVKNINLDVTILVDDPSTYTLPNAVVVYDLTENISLGITTNVNRENVYRSQTNSQEVKITNAEWDREFAFSGNLGAGDIRDFGVFYTILTNEGIAFNLDHVLDAALEYEGSRVGVRVYTANSIDVVFFGTLIGGANKITSTTPGDFIELEFRKGNWWIIEEIGTWTKSTV